ncbi:MAG TPA: hypothetical protein VH639_00420 [Bryobacteraceae bacterium]|jgi:hypothetical protein
MAGVFRRRGISSRPRRGSDIPPPSTSARLWDASIAAAKVSGGLVLAFAMVSLPHLDLHIGRFLAAMAPEPVVRFFTSNDDIVDPSKVRAIASRVEDGFERPDSIAAPNSRKTFGLGSSKQDVAAAQGQPVNSGSDIWRYGDSEVYFVAGHVIGWRDAPRDPLKLR